MATKTRELMLKVFETKTNPTKSPNWVSSLNSYETKALIENYYKELMSIAFARKSDSNKLAKLLGRYMEASIPFKNLSHENSTVRRLTALLIALIFEQKSDLFKQNTSAVKFATITKHRVCLARIPSHLRNIRPQPLYHAKDVLMFYQPVAAYPGGQTCYIDSEKLSNILVSKECLRIPDPMENVVWLDFDEPDRSFTLALDPPEVDTSSDSLSSNTSSDSETEEHNLSPSPRKSPVPLFRVSSPKKQGKYQKIHKQPAETSIFCREQTAEAETSAPATGPHRIKCFTFFRRPKGSNLDDVQPVQRTAQDLGSPQFESVNDWATAKDYSHYSAQFKLMQIKPTDSTASPSNGANFGLIQQGRDYKYLLDKRPKTMLELSEHLNAILSRKEQQLAGLGTEHGKRYLSQQTESSRNETPGAATTTTELPQRAEAARKRNSQFSIESLMERRKSSQSKADNSKSKTVRAQDSSPSRAGSNLVKVKVGNSVQTASFGSPQMIGAPRSVKSTAANTMKLFSPKIQSSSKSPTNSTSPSRGRSPVVVIRRLKPTEILIVKRK